MEAPEGNEACQKKALSNLKKKNSKNAKRFSDEQIKSLESVFKLESKLEPCKKLEIARDLGLQPRQVAIWFQNKRARWRSKQIEQEYKVLKANYDDLYAQSELLMRENQSLQMQIRELENLLKNHVDSDVEFKEKPGCQGIQMNGVQNVDHEETISKYFGQGEEGEIIMSFCEQGDSSPLASPETWSNLCSDALFDQSCGTSSWWATG